MRWAVVIVKMIAKRVPLAPRPKLIGALRLKTQNGERIRVLGCGVGAQAKRFGRGNALHVWLDLGEG
jgi:hypothetical protein